MVRKRRLAGCNSRYCCPLSRSRIGSPGKGTLADRQGWVKVNIRGLFPRLPETGQNLGGGATRRVAARMYNDCRMTPEGPPDRGRAAMAHSGGNRHRRRGTPRFGRACAASFPLYKATFLRDLP